MEKTVLVRFVFSLILFEILVGRCDRVKDDSVDSDPSIAILYPADGALVEPDRLMVAFHVSAFTIARLGSSLTGVRLLMNGNSVMESGIVLHGNDGTAQYHIEMHDLTPAVYELRAQLVLREGEPTPPHRDAVSVIEVLGHAAPEAEEGAAPAGASARSIPYFVACPPLPAPRCAPADSANGTCPAAAAASCAGCSGHGVCSAGGCRCRPDWFGPDCAHSAFTSAEYLPHPAPWAAAAGCQASQRWFAAALRLQVPPPPAAAAAAAAAALVKAAAPPASVREH